MIAIRRKNRSLKDITNDILKAVNHKVPLTDPNVAFIKLDQRGIKQLLEINETIEETKKTAPL